MNKSLNEIDDSQKIGNQTLKEAVLDYQVYIDAYFKYIKQYVDLLDSMRSRRYTLSETDNIQDIRGLFSDIWISLDDIASISDHFAETFKSLNSKLADQL